MSKRKLLLADDSITIQKVVNLTFADEGIEVIAVGDGDSAMRKFDEFMPDLVMADVNMPGLNGYEVCRIIKQTEETRNIPVILLVGSFEPFDEAEAQNVGANDYLTKPFQSIRQLVNKVTDLLNQKPIIEQSAKEDYSAGNSQDESNVAPPVDSFADTLELEEQQTETSTDFGDAGMDDEMIETSPANDFASNSDSFYQNETTIDYGKTQPLHADDLKGFDIVSGEKREDSVARLDEYQTENAEQETETSEINQQGNELIEQESEPETPRSFVETADDMQENAAIEKTPEEEENAPVISESEPQLDYSLATEEPEVEKEITEAETLEPDVSYEPQEDREAVFSEDEEKTEESTVEEEPAHEEKAELREFEESPETESFEREEESQTFEAAKEGSFDEPQNEEPAYFAETNAEYREEEPRGSFGEYVEADEKIEEEAEKEESETAEIVSPQEESLETEDREETREFLEESTEEAKPPEVVDETPMAAFSNNDTMDFDDDDLLDLPPLVEETGIRPQIPVQPVLVKPETTAELVTEPETKITLTKTVAESEMSVTFPPELIEAIAQKVAEKISAQTMSEVLPQIADLVVKKLAEQRKE